VLLGGIFGGGGLGCQPPCDTLRLRICQTLEPDSRICTLFRQELQRQPVARGHCQALLKTWPHEGKKRLHDLEWRYQQYQRRLFQRYAQKYALKRLEKAESRLRRLFRKMLHP
jgi:hypothetical protein